MGRVGKEKGIRCEKVGLEYPGKTTARSVFLVSGIEIKGGEWLFPSLHSQLRHGSTRKC